MLHSGVSHLGFSSRSSAFATPAFDGRQRSFDYDDSLSVVSTANTDAETVDSNSSADMPGSTFNNEDGSRHNRSSPQMRTSGARRSKNVLVRMLDTNDDAAWKDLPLIEDNDGCEGSDKFSRTRYAAPTSRRNEKTRTDQPITGSSRTARLPA